MWGSRLPSARNVVTRWTVRTNSSGTTLPLTDPPSPSDRRKSVDDLPGPKGLPLVGTALDYLLGRDGLSFDKMHECYNKRYRKYGPIYRECFGPQTVVVITDYQEYNKVIRADGKRPTRIALEPLLEYRLRSGLDCGMTNGNGEVWYRYRSAVNQKMLRPIEVNQFMAAMDSVAKDLVNALARSRDEHNVIDKVNDVLFNWSMESVATFLLGVRLGTLSPDATNTNSDAKNVISNITAIFDNLHELMFNLPFYKHFRTPTWKVFEAHCTEAIQSGIRIINQRMAELQSGGDGDIHSEGSQSQSLALYMMEKKSLSEADIAIMIVELLIGSVETTSGSLLWTLYLLAKHSKCQQVLFDEVNSVIGSNVDTITPDMVNSMRYLKACIKESMRIYPVIFATSRILSKDVEVFGYNLPPGTHVQANIFTLFRDPKVFPDPDCFKPERWLHDKNDEMSVVNLVWGHGARMCVGRRVAEQEMYLALARIIQKFHVFYPKVKPPENVLRTVLTTVDPLPIKFSDRATPTRMFRDADQP